MEEVDNDHSARDGVVAMLAVRLVVSAAVIKPRSSAPLRTLKRWTHRCQGGMPHTLAFSPPFLIFSPFLKMMMTD